MRPTLRDHPNVCSPNPRLSPRRPSRRETPERSSERKRVPHEKPVIAAGRARSAGIQGTALLRALLRLAGLPKYVDIEIVNLRSGLEAGYGAPRLTVAPALKEVRALAGADSPLLSPALVRHCATIEPAASEIRRLGLERIAGIRAEMQAIIDEHFPGVTIESFLRRLNDDPRYTFSTEDEVLQYSVVALAARPRESTCAAR